MNSNDTGLRINACAVYTYDRLSESKMMFTVQSY